MRFSKIISSFALLLVSCVSSADAETPFRLMADFSSSDPGTVLDQPKHRSPFDEFGFFANSLYGKSSVLSIKNSQFLGQPMIAKLDPDEIGLPKGNFYDYYLLSMQYNIPAVRNLPLNKYRYVRFDSMFSIQAPNDDMKPLYLAIIRLEGLKRRIGFPLSRNFYLEAKERTISTKIQEVKNTLSDAIYKANDDSVKGHLRLARTEVESLTIMPQSDYEKLAQDLATIVENKIVPHIKDQPEEITKSVDKLKESTYALAKSWQISDTRTWGFLERKEAFDNSLESAIGNARVLMLSSDGNKVYQSEFEALNKTLASQRVQFSGLAQIANNELQQEKMIAAVDEASQTVIKFYKSLERYKGRANYRDRIVYGNYKELERTRAGSLPWNFNVVSIYPTNELLDVKFQNVQDFDVKVEPKYMEFVAGSANWHSKDTTDYQYKLARVVGITNHFGSASWTYYPAKRQPVILGNKTSFALLQVNRGTTGNLRLNSCLNYELLLTVPFCGPKLYDEAEIDLASAVSLDSLLRLRCADLGSDPISKLFGETFKIQAKSAPQLVTGEDQQPMITNGKKIYRFKDDSLDTVEFDEKGDVKLKNDKFSQPQKN